MGKVIDFNARLNAKSFSNGAMDKKSNIGEVLDITEARQEILMRDRREVKRTILTEFVGAFVVLPNKGLLKVSLHDISENGLAFELDMIDGSFLSGEEVAMRVYLNHTTYFPFTVSISNGRVLEHQGIIRHGATFIRDTMNDVALHHFVKFIETVSAALKTDSGDILVSHIS